MPDLPISGLPSVASPTSTDLLAIVQAGVTSHITPPGLFGAGLATHLLVYSGTGLLSDSGVTLAMLPQLAAANSYTVAPQTIVIDADGHVGTIVRAHSGTQTGDLAEWQSSASTTLARIDFKGAGTFAGLQVGPAGTSGRVNIDTGNPVVPGLVVRAQPAQSADLGQWTDSAGTRLAWIDAAGTITANPSSFTVPAVRAFGQISVSLAGYGLSVKTGANCKMGVATLAAGTVTVATTAVTAASLIFLSDAGGGVLANIGSLSVGTVTGGTSFVVNSSNVLDTSKVNWLIIEPA